MEREEGNGGRMRKWRENEEINRELWTNSSRTRTLEGTVHGTCIILMRHASIHRMNHKQLGDFKRRRTNLALLMKNNKETSKEEEQTWLC